MFNAFVTHRSGIPLKLHFTAILQQNYKN